MNQTCKTMLEMQGRAHKWYSLMADQKQGGQLEHTYSISVRIRDVALRNCQKRWTIARSCERGSRISALAVRYDDDEVHFWRNQHSKPLTALIDLSPCKYLLSELQRRSLIFYITWNICTFVFIFIFILECWDTITFGADQVSRGTGFGNY